MIGNNTKQCSSNAHIVWIYNAHLKSVKIPKSMPITGPSIFVSAAVTRTEADTTDTSKSKANRFWHGKATRHKVRDWISSPNDAAVSILDQKWLMALVILFKNFTQGQGQPTIYKIRKNDKAEPSSPCSWWPLCNLSQGSRQHQGLLAEAPFRLDGSYGSSGRTVGINDCLFVESCYMLNKTLSSLQKIRSN